MTSLGHNELKQAVGHDDYILLIYQNLVISLLVIEPIS